MKTGFFISLSSIFSLIIVPQVAVATISNNVQVETNTGNNTICVNGKCTTTSGSTSKSKVCVNGKCYESDGGDLQVESEDGSTKVNIQNNGSSSVNISQKSEGSVTNSVEVNQEALGASTGAAAREAEEAKEKAKKEVEGKLDTENKKFDIKKFVEEKLSFLRRLVTFQFLFGSK